MGSKHIGRAAVSSPANRFEQLACEVDLEQLVPEEMAEAIAPGKVPTQFFEDQSRSLLRRNDSPDLPFRFSLNPYRGCEHGCAYCYARPGHETLGLNAGIDFETKILVKTAAAKILRAELNHSSWRGECITLSGITDCYQPAERHYQITRQCLEVLVESRQAFAIVTKNALVVRDLDLLQQAAAQKTVHVNISVTSLDAQLTRKLEPRTSTPSARLRAIERLAEAGVPVATMVAPVVPGLTDHEMPRILEAVRDAGALAASYQLLRLPLTVLPVFVSWLQSNYPERSALVESRIRSCRSGKLNESEFFQRMKGGGPYAENIRTTFRTFARRYGLDQGLPDLETSQFRPPRNAQGQQLLF